MADGRRGVWIAIAVVAVVVGLVGWLMALSPSGEAPPALAIGGVGGVVTPTPATVGAVAAATGIRCAEANQARTTVISKDFKQRGVQTVHETHRVWVRRNGDWSLVGTVVDGGTTTLSSGDDIRVLYGDNSTETASGYYASLFESTIPCDNAAPVIEGFQKDKNSTSVTMSFFNSDDGLANFGGDPQSIGANGQETFTMKLRTSADDYYGDPSIIAVFSSHSNVTSSISMPEGVSTTAPSCYSGLAASSSWAFELPGLAGTTLVPYDVTFLATGTEPSTANNITVQLFDKSWYVNQDSGEPLQGYCDEDQTDLGSNNARGTIAMD